MPSMQWAEMMIPGVPVGNPGVGVPRVEIPGALLGRKLQRVDSRSREPFVAKDERQCKPSRHGGNATARVDWLKPSLQEPQKTIYRMDCDGDDPQNGSQQGFESTAHRSGLHQLNQLNQLSENR